MAQSNYNTLATRKIKENGNIFLALFGAVAIVGIVGATAAGVMKGPMKVMSDISSRAVAENEIMANTKMGVMALSQTGFTKDCDNDGTVEAYPYNSSAVGKTGGVPTGGGYLPSEIDTTRWTDPWGNSYTYCVWDHGTLIDNAACGGAGQNRLPGLNKTTFPAGDVNKQTLIAVLSSGANRTYETTCQDWATADANADGDLLDVGDTQLVNKPVGSDDIVMSYTYAEAAMATSTNWRIQSTTTNTAEITEDQVEIGGDTASGNGVETTIAGSVMALGGLKLSTDPGDDSISGACNAANDQALRVNTGGASKALEVCESGAWTPISGSSTTTQCTITAPVIANSGNAWVQDATKISAPWDIFVEGNYAYVTGFNGNSFTVIDISDPLNPVIANAGAAWVQDATKLNQAWNTQVVGNYAYVVSHGSNSLTVIDISDPLNPAIANAGAAWVQDAVKLNQAWDVEISGNYAYVPTHGSNSLTIVDISDPLNPAIANAGNAWVQDATKLLGASGVSVSGNYAYVTSEGGNSFTVIDISNPLNPVIANAGAAWVQDATKLGGARDVIIAGNYAYVAAYNSSSFTVIDISDPLNPAIANAGAATIQDTTKLNNVSDIDLTGHYIVASSYTGDSLTVIDISDPLNPVIADSGNAWVQDATKLNGSSNVRVKGNYAFVSSFDGNSVSVIDLGCDPEYVALPSGADIGFNPNSPNCLVSNDGPFKLAATQTGMGGYVNDISGDGTYIYAGQGNFLRAYTFDGSNFIEVGARDTGAPVETIFTNNGYVFIANWWQGIEVLKFDGTNFNVVDTYGGLGNTRGVWSDGKTVFAYSAGTINAFNFDGATLTLLDSLTAGNKAEDLWVDGDYIYVADYDGGVGMAVAKWDGSSLSLVEAIDTFQGSIVRPQNGYIFLADTFSGIRAYAFDGKTITDLGESPQNLNSTKLEVSGTHIFTNNSGVSLYAYTYDENGFKVSNSIPADVRPLYYDGTYVFTSGSSEIRAYSGFECLKAGEKTPHTSTQIDYTSEQLFDHTSSADGTAETYGTSILLKASEFDSEAGVAFNVGSVLGDSETPSSAITGARVGMNGEGALLFKTKDDSGNLNTNMMIDSDGDLGINTTAPFDVSGKVQIGDLASSGYTSFNPEKANCVVNNGGPFSLINSFDTPGNSQNIFIDDNYIYIADGTIGGLRAYTFDGSAFTEIGFIVPGDDIYDVWSDGTYIYASSKASGVIVYTFDGTTFTQVATQPATDQVYDVWGDGTYIYVADGTAGIIAYTFNGTTFTQVGSFNIASGTFESVWGDETYLYVTAANGNPYEMMVLEFDGSNFSLIAGTMMPHIARDVIGDGRYLYVAIQSSGIAVVDFDGTSLNVLDTKDLSETPQIWSDGVYIYGGNGSSAISALDFDGNLLSIKNTSPVNVGQTGLTVIGDGTYIYSTNSSGYISAYSGFECTKVDGWQGPTHGLLISGPKCDYSSMAIANSGNAWVTDATKLNDAKRITLSDNYAYVTSISGDSLTVVDISDPLNPVIANSGNAWVTDATKLNGPRDIQVKDNYAYIVSNSGDSLTVVDISDPLNPAIANSGNAWITDATKLNGPRYLQIKDNYAFVTATNGNSLTVIDISDPLNPVIANSGNAWITDATKLNGAKDISISGNYAYIVSNLGDSLTVVDISDPLNPVIANGGNAWITDATKLNGVNGIKISGNYAFVTASNSDSLTVIDISNPLNPIIANSGNAWVTDATKLDGVSNIKISGNYAIVTSSNSNSLTVIDISNPLNPVIANDGNAWITDATKLNDTKGLSVFEQYAYVVSQTGKSLTVIDLGCSPISEGQVSFFGNDGKGDVDTNILFSKGFDIKGTNPDGSTLTDILSIDSQGTTTFKQGTVDLIDEAGAFEFLSRGNIADTVPSLILQRYNGTQSSPTTVNSGDVLGALTWAGYDGTGIATNGNSAIYAKATGTPLDGIIPNGLFMSTDSAGNALGSSNLALLSTGKIGIGTEDPLESLHVAGRMSITEGLHIGYDNKCNVTHDKGFVRYIASDNTVEYCTAREWISITQQIPNIGFDPEAANCVANNDGPFKLTDTYDTTGNANGIWSDGTYIYIADYASGVHAFTFDGKNFTLKGSYDTAGIATGVWGDDTYIYVGDDTSGVHAFTFDGTNFTLKGSYDTIGNAYYIWGDGSYIYVTDNTNGVNAFTFNGTNFTLAGTYNTTDRAIGIWGDDTYIYVADWTSGIHAFTFDGTNFTLEGTYNTTDRAGDVWGDGTYIYVADWTSGVHAFTFDGTNFTLKGSYDTTGTASSVWGDGTYIYVGDDTSGVHAFTFDGTNFTLANTYDTTGNAFYVWGDGSYVYVTDNTSGVHAFSGFECLSTENETELIAWDGIENTEMKITPSDGAASDFFGFQQIGFNGKIALIGAYGDDDNGADSGSAYVFDVTTSTQLFKLLSSDGASGDAFGLSTALGSNYAVIGAYGDDDNGADSGSAYVFDVTTGTQIQKLTASDGAAGDQFGKRVSVYGKYAIIGARLDDDNGNNSGSVYVFDITTGTQIQKLTASDGAAGDRFGASVALDGNYAIIGAQLDDDNGADSGSVYVFDITTGTQIQKLTASDGAAGDFFGQSISLEGNYAIIGAPFDDDNGFSSGSAYVFDVTTGTQLFKLLPSDGAASDFFGIRVSLDKKYAIIGAYGDDDNGSSSGSAYVFDVTTGTQLFKLLPSDGAANDLFGQSISLEGNYAIIGAPFDDDNGSSSGSAYVFDVTTGTQLFKLLPSDSAAGDYFGIQVSLDKKYAIISARLDDDNGADSGSIYVFDITTSTQIQKLTASDGAAGDYFGTDVGIDNNNVIIGAQFDDDNGADSGSAYIYQGNWTKRHTSGVECYPDPIEIDDFKNMAANSPAIVTNLEITGNVKNCPLTLATDGSFSQIMINGLDFYTVPYATVNSGDLVTITTISSATADDTYNNILTVGDQRALYTVHTAP